MVPGPRNVLVVARGEGMRTGMAADFAVFDPDTVAPRMPDVVHDLPAGAKRLKQTADGMLATIVGGEVLLRNNEHTGALPGCAPPWPISR